MDAPYLITNRGTAFQVLDSGYPALGGSISIGTDLKDTHPNAGLRLTFSDITKDWQNHIAPTREQVGQAVEYAKTVNGTLLVHCAAGQSRSVGIVLAILCSKGMKAEDAYEALTEAAKRTYLRKLRRTYLDLTPNQRIVMHADEMYGYDGALIEGYCRRYSTLSFEDALSSFWRAVTQNEEDDPLRLPLWDYS